MRASRSVLVAFLLVAAVSAPGVGRAESPIQPGAEVTFGVDQCTLNFVYTGSTKTYIGTAGHCAKVGDRATSSSGEFGTVRYSVDDETIDFALIEVDSAKVSQVDRSVRSFGRINGATDENETSAADEVWVYGYGIGFGSVAQLRPRSGLLVQDTDTWYTADMPAVNGDSGGPVVHARTRKALGIVSSYGVSYLQPTTDRGPTVEHIVRTLRAAGFQVALAT